MESKRHLWEYGWFRDVAALAAIGGLLYAVYAARAVTAPALIGLGLAYVFNPVVTFFHRRWRWPRWLGTMALLASGGIVTIGLGLYVVPKVLHQTGVLTQKLPQYIERINEHLGIDWSALTQQAQEALSPQQGQDGATVAELAQKIDVGMVAQTVAGLLGTGLGLVGSALGAAGYLAFLMAMIVLCFFYFSCQFDKIGPCCQPMIPASSRQTVVRITRMMDQTVSAFMRGRLIQSLVMAVLLCTGWWLAGVPYWLLLGIVSGVFNLVPFAASVGWVAAVVLTWVDQLTGTQGVSFWRVVIWPTLVYGVAQFVDGWVVEPLVQGKATNLGPLTVFLAVLIGGSMAGIVGVILAIPVTACTKILLQEVVLPKIRLAVKEL